MSLEKPSNSGRKGLLYVTDTQTIISTCEGTTVINSGRLDYLYNTMLDQLLRDGTIDPLRDKPDTFVFDEVDETLVQHYLGRKNEFLDDRFVAAMT